MKFLSLIGKRLKDDAVIDVLECAEIDVVYEFDRCHENTPDRYWAASKKDGFRLGFDADQVLEVIFLYAAPDEGFASVSRNECDVPFFSSTQEAEAHALERNLHVTKGRANFLGVQRDWVRLEYEKQSVHYEFRGGQLALVTITKAR